MGHILLCQPDLNAYTSVHNCTWSEERCFNLTACGYPKPTQCPKMYPTPPGGIIKGNITKTLLHDVNLVMTHVSYNITNILSAYLTQCSDKDETYTWSLSHINDIVSDYKGRLAIQVPPVRFK